MERAPGMGRAARPPLAGWRGGRRTGLGSSRRSATRGAWRGRYLSYVGRRDRVEDFVVGDGGLELQQEPLILGVVAGALRLVPREGADRLPRFPEGEQEKVHHVALGAPEDVHAAIARRPPVIGETRRFEVRLIALRVTRANPSVPGAGDHAGPSLRPAGSERAWRSLAD